MFFVLLKSARTQKILQIGKVGLGASAAVRRRDLTLASGQGGEGEEGEKCPLVPVHQGSKCSEEGAVHGKVLKLLGRF